MIAITKFIPRNAFSSSLVEHKALIVQLSILAALRGRSPKKIFLLRKLFHLDWVVFLAQVGTLLTFLFHFHNSSFLFFSFFFDWLSLGTTWRLASGVVKEVSRVLAACVISSLNHSLNFLCRPRQHFPHHLIKHVFVHY